MYVFLALERSVAETSKICRPAPKQSWDAAWKPQCTATSSSLMLLYIIYSKRFIISDWSHGQTDGLSSSWTFERLRECGGWMKKKKQYCYDVRKKGRPGGEKEHYFKHTQEECCWRSLWLPSALCSALLSSSVSLSCCKIRRLRHCCWLTGNIVIILGCVGDGGISWLTV